jgi:alanine dehydrogenase
MKRAGSILLGRAEIRGLLGFEEYLQVVEEAFRSHAQGKTLKPGLLHVDSVDGEFHIKAGGLQLSKRYFGLKVNGGFFRNRERFGMPNIQGIILLCDGENGYPLAVMDSSEITMKRTGAAAAIAAKHLARPESAILTVCGCGIQGHVQLYSMKSVLPIKKAYVYDIDRERSESFAEEMSAQCGIEVVATRDLEKSVRESDVLVTCTPSRRQYIEKGFISAGTFVAAMGADSPEKQELDPELLRTAKVVVDLLEQCANVGELHHAIERGMAKEAVYAELSEIIVGSKPGRTSKEEIIIFDATGTALQDVAASAAIYEKALIRGSGQVFDFFA